MKTKIWKKVSDGSVQIVWRRTCDCKGFDKRATLYPCDIAYTGIPTCAECGSEMEYVKTLVLI